MKWNGLSFYSKLVRLKDQIRELVTELEKVSIPNWFD